LLKRVHASAQSGDTAAYQHELMQVLRKKMHGG
jgi:hypothetical protein